MIIALRIFFPVVLASMLAVTSWASLQVPLWGIPREIGGHPWFIATLFDAYWGFFTFYAWQFYKEPSWTARALWFVALLLLGNIAMAVYGMILVFHLPTDAKPADLLLRGAPVHASVPAALIAILVGISAVGAML